MPKTNAIHLRQGQFGPLRFLLPAIVVCAAIIFWLTMPLGIAAEKSALSPAQARQFIADNRGNANFIIVDLRTRNEFEQGHIEGARLIPYYAVNFNRIVSQLDRGATILLYCQRGRQSPLAFRALEKLRFTDVFILDGGVVAWTEAGFPLVF